MSTTPVKLAKTDKVVMEVTPGRPVAAVEIPRSAVPRYGFVKLCRQADGTYTPVLTSTGTTVRMTADLARQLGIDVDYNTLMRLYIAGFVKGCRPAPNTVLLDLVSLYDHLQATRDPEFWTEERREIYRRAL